MSEHVNKIDLSRFFPISVKKINRGLSPIYFSIAVGMPVTRHPPHRSVREELPHTAPTSG